MALLKEIVRTMTMAPGTCGCAQNAEEFQSTHSFALLMTVLDAVVLLAVEMQRHLRHLHRLPTILMRTAAIILMDATATLVRNTALHRVVIAMQTWTSHTMCIALRSHHLRHLHRLPTILMRTAAIILMDATATLVRNTALHRVVIAMQTWTSHTICIALHVEAKS